MPKAAGVLSLVTSPVIISSMSLIISVISTAIAVASFRRSRQTQAYDYATRLQIEGEEIRGRRTGEVFSYSAELVNLGIKPVEIDRIYIDYGGDRLEASWHFHVEGNSRIPPGGRLRIDFSLTEKDYQATLAKFGLQQCLFRLRVRYFNIAGGTVEAQRKLMAIGPGEITFYAQRGDALT